MGTQSDTKGLTVRKEDDFSEWYTDVVQKAALADYAPVKGFMIIRPNAYAMWEAIQDYFNPIMRKKGVRNAYFPLLIPHSFFVREGEHAAGFAPELAYIAGTGEGNEGDRLALRPTSETIMYDSYSKWIRSHRDLPLCLNQWCNVVRWEVKQTKPFLRTREFLWQEGHCAFATNAEAEANMHEMIAAYKALSEDVLAIPVLVGRKSKAETFPGAVCTMTIEGLMPDGKALQMGTSHNLGQGFAKVFNVSFQGDDKTTQYAHQTSWGFSTRLLGAVIMVHGDNKGLVIPPKLARQKGVIVPILFEDSKKTVLAGARHIQRVLKDFDVVLDAREEYNPGWKFSEWEMQGIPLRIEIGPKDVANKQVMLVRRDTGAKQAVHVTDIARVFSETLETMQNDMFARAKQFLTSRLDSAKTMSELTKKLGEGKLVKVYMVDDKKVEEALHEATGGGRSRIVETVASAGTCVSSGKKTNTLAIIGRSY